MLTAHDKGGWIHPDDRGEPRIGTPRVSIADDEVSVLAWLAQGHDVLEIGTGLGISTRALAQRAHTVTTHDIDEWVHDNIWPDLPATCVADRMTLHGPFTFAFIDGDHSGPAIDEDVALAERLMPEGGLIVCHDALALELHFRDWLILPTTYGLAIRVCDAS